MMTPRNELILIMTPKITITLFLLFCYYYHKPFRYHAGHSEPSRRRGTVSGVMSAIDSYKSAFRVQLGGMGGTGGAARDLQRQRQIKYQEKEVKDSFRHNSTK